LYLVNYRLLHSVQGMAVAA